MISTRGVVAERTREGILSRGVLACGRRAIQAHPQAAPSRNTDLRYDSSSRMLFSAASYLYIPTPVPSSRARYRCLTAGA